MVQVSLTASVKVLGGPTLPLPASFDPESYAMGVASLDASGGAEEEQVVPLLPTEGTVLLLAVRARDEAGAPAAVTVTPSNAGTDGDDVPVLGSLVVANAAVLEAMVAGGPRTVTIRNEEATPVQVDVLACLGQ